MTNHKAVTFGLSSLSSLGRCVPITALLAFVVTITPTVIATDDVPSPAANGVQVIARAVAAAGQDVSYSIGHHVMWTVPRNPR
jgi:hypothetical protein